MRAVCQWLTILACAALTWLAQPTLSVAQEDYDSLIRDALAEFEAGRYEEAATLFGRAHEQNPSARTHRGLGLAYFEGRHYVLAVRHLRAALADRRRALNAQQRSSAQDVLRRAEGFVARFTVATTPANVVIEVDGQPAEVENGEVLIDAGRHELVARADGYETDRRIVDVTVATGVQPTLEFHLSPEGQQQPAPVQEPVVAERAPVDVAAAPASGGAGVAPYIVIGVGGAALLTSVVTGLMANGVHSDLEDKCPGGECSYPGYQDDIDRGKTLQVATNVLLVGGLVTTAAGVVWLLLSPSGDSAEPAASAGCDFNGCSASFTHRF